MPPTMGCPSVRICRPEWASTYVLNHTVLCTERRQHYQDVGSTALCQTNRHAIEAVLLGFEKRAGRLHDDSPETKNQMALEVGL